MRSTILSLVTLEADSAPTDLKHFKQIQDFAHHVNEMLAQIADVLQPRDFDKYIAHAIDELQ